MFQTQGTKVQQMMMFKSLKPENHHGFAISPADIAINGTVNPPFETH
jgi:hypothetical protein